MNQRDVLNVPKFDYLILAAIIGLAFYMAFIPHRVYPYPLHVDDWKVMGWARAIVQQGTPLIVEPFNGAAAVGDFIYLAEMGFCVFLAVFQQISGIAWITLFRYFPGVIFIITVLSVYVMARREGFGWEAAFFACLVITTVGILGPAFLLPVSMGLLFIPLSIFLAFNFRSIWSYLVLFIFTCFLVSMHAVTAVGVIIILAPFILLNIKGDFKHSLGLTLALALPFVAVSLITPIFWVGVFVPWVKNLLTPVAIQTEVQVPRIIHTYGWLPILISLLGSFLLAMKGGRKNYGLVLGLLALVLLLFSYYSLHYGVAIIYYRGILYTLLLLGVSAGFGLMWVRKIRLPDTMAEKLKFAFLTRNVGNILCLVLVGLTLAVCIPLRQSIPYYHMIDEEDYQAFVWIEANVDDSYDQAILDPWKATAFSAITMKRVYTRIQVAPTVADHEACAFLSQGCVDTAFLRENSISVVYTRDECSNPDLVEVRENVYLLK